MLLCEGLSCVLMSFNMIRAEPTLRMRADIWANCIVPPFMVHNVHGKLDQCDFSLLKVSTVGLMALAVQDSIDGQCAGKICTST